MKESLLLYTGVKEKDVEVIYNGIDYAFYANSRQVNPKKTVITYCGRLVPEKGVQILLGALSEISKEKIECYILGEGVQRAELESIAGQIENTDIDIFFEGRQADVTPWLKQTDIFVYPVMCEEGFGLSVAEAMAAGAVCIVSAKGGLPELITDGENGFLVQNISEETLAEKLKEVISMKKAGQLEKLAENARRTASRFDIHTMVGQLEKIATINSNRK